MEIKNPLYESVHKRDLPKDLQHHSIRDVYEIDGVSAYCIIVGQRWLPYSWCFSTMDYYLSDVSVERYAQTTIPLLGSIGGRLGLKAIVIEEKE